MDPAAGYKIRVFGSGDALIRIDDKRLSHVSYSKEAHSFKECIRAAGNIKERTYGSNF
ncbi:hypothetical protein [Lunatibacter salilacus]|uniref:hypothetical protein n=1 Tax=Lunatibacter salilacus TaxID=2483804 RepID=UPI00131B215A|nr:hypothetical protein [Lunatibacter salilacus]